MVQAIKNNQSPQAIDAYNAFRTMFPSDQNAKNNRNVIDRIKKPLEDGETITGIKGKTNVLELAGTRADYIFEEIKDAQGKLTGKVRVTSTKNPDLSVTLDNIQYVRFEQKASNASKVASSNDDAQSFFVKTSKQPNPSAPAGATIDTTPVAGEGASKAKVKTYTGTDAADVIRGRYMLDDNINGGKGDDILLGNGGKDVIDGGAGKDIAVLNGSFKDAKITKNKDGSYQVKYKLVDSKHPQGIEQEITIKNIEQLRFRDGTFSIDPAQAYNDYSVSENMDPTTAGSVYNPTGGPDDSDPSSFVAD